VSALSDTTFRVASFQSGEAGTLVWQDSAAASMAGFEEAHRAELSEMPPPPRGGEKQVSDQ
jgi:hypothetical protein